MAEYPHLRFQRHWELRPDVIYEIGQCEAIISAISEMPLRPEYHERLLRVSLIKGARATTAIEGNTLTEEEIELVARGESLPPSKEYQQVEVRNILGAMNQLLREVAQDQAEAPVTSNLIRTFHGLIGKDLGEHLDAIPGQYRKDERVVGTYRCPDHRDVPELMESLSHWLEGEFNYSSGGQAFLDAVIEAIVAHVYIEWIHPFGDGNGRTGRLVEFYILLRAGNPDVSSHILSNFYNDTRPEYYRQLDRAGESGDLSDFIAYAVEGFRDGLLETLRTIQRSQFLTAWRSFIYDKFADRKYRKTVFKRRRNLILEMPLNRWLTADELPEITTKVARAYAGFSDRTVLRDLEALKEMELIRKDGRQYQANSELLRLQMPNRLRRSRAPADPSRPS